MPREIKTPWGSITPQVSLFPIYYLFFIYGFVYILPYGKELIGVSWFDWLRSEDGPLEWIQFAEYLISSFLHIFYEKEKERVKFINLAFDSYSLFCCCRRGNKLGRESNWN